ncbi:phosphotransferase enzyme family protein [Muriicola soli]|uniref:Aminoglycoside phosphotransferase family protein n=1 Tax=Muriicola soli TaxID=2507538 RepID=A0A411E6F7_9FLAO|nr:aminoglycoside phosphotransferase family protein [Muriicola soli]QBA63212.1 aminoglycoside phosphotransferase family protein [Muriicola soli]
MEFAAAKALKHFVIEQKDYKIRPVSQGYINTTFQILDGDQTEFILQRINGEVFPDVPAIMKNLKALIPLLRAENYHSISYMPTKARLPYYKDEEGGYWRLLTFVPDSVAFDYTKDPEVAYEAGRILGLFHKQLDGVSVEEFREVLPGFHNLNHRRQEYLNAFKQAKKERRQNALKEIEFAEETFLKLDKDIDSLSLRICHNDTKLNNFLFSKDTGKGLCLIDLDTVMPGRIIYDLGDIIRTLANPVPEDEKNLKTIGFDLKMVSSFLKGIEASELQLSDAEKQAIPAGVVLMPYLHGLRALTDYLNNDVYYRISYPDHNLDRSRNLFYFTQLAFERSEALLSLVEEILGH